MHVRASPLYSILELSKLIKTAKKIGDFFFYNDNNLYYDSHSKTKFVKDMNAYDKKTVIIKIIITMPVIQEKLRRTQMN